MHYKTNTNKGLRNIAGRPADKASRSTMLLAYPVAVPPPKRASTPAISLASESFLSTLYRDASQWVGARRKGGCTRNQNPGGRVDRCCIPQRGLTVTSHLPVFQWCGIEHCTGLGQVGVLSKCPGRAQAMYSTFVGPRPCAARLPGPGLLQSLVGGLNWS